MKISVFEAEDWERKAFEKLKDNHELRFCSQSLEPENVTDYAGTEVLSTFIYSDLSNAVLEKLKNLKFIATRSTGFNHIDLEYCNSRDIAVANVPYYGDNTVAEHVFGLMLTISHNLSLAIDRTRRGDFTLQGLRGFDLKGKTLGVVGTGQIGRWVIKIAKGFDMSVIAFDVKPNEETAQKLGYKYLALDELLKESDIVTLHVPASKKTHHLISEKEFEKMKKGVVLINTSRGSVVDVQALIRALAEGKVAAVGLDVLPEEPTIREEAELLRSVYQRKHNMEALLADHVLLRLRNVYITPHSAFNTTEAVQRIHDTTVKNIEAFARHESENIVNDVKELAKV